MRLWRTAATTDTSALLTNAFKVVKATIDKTLTARTKQWHLDFRQQPNPFVLLTQIDL